MVQLIPSFIKKYESCFRHGLNVQSVINVLYRHIKVKLTQGTRYFSIHQLTLEKASR